MALKRINLPQGTQIFSNAQSEAMTRNAAAVALMGGDNYSYGGNSYYISIDAKNVREFNDIVRMAQNARQKDALGGIHGIA
jgi:hypothetical protein